MEKNKNEKREKKKKVWVKLLGLSATSTFLKDPKKLKNVQYVYMPSNLCQ